MPDNPMGSEENVITKDFEAAAKAMSMSREEAMGETYDLLGMVLGKVPSHIEKNGDYDRYVEGE
ncbi:MAG: hypothetical protein WC798_02770 [Candidatus Paceibacterota bacterium]|jgi:hypothetical protein